MIPSSSCSRQRQRVSRNEGVGKGVMSRLSRSRRSYSHRGCDNDIDNAIRKFDLLHPLTFHLFNTKKLSIMAERMKQEPIASQPREHSEAASNPAVPRQLGQQPQDTRGTAVHQQREKHVSKWPQQAAQLHNAIRASVAASMVQPPSYGQAKNLPTPAASPFRPPLYQPQPQQGQLHRTIRPKTTTIHGDYDAPATPWFSRFPEQRLPEQ